jgi:hypothetical protein
MADGEEVKAYLAEPIPDADSLFLRIHRANIDADGLPLPRAYAEHEGGMSTNWSKYADAELTRRQAANIIHPKTLKPKNPDDFGVLAFVVRKVREIPKLTVQHTPLPTNRAHTDVIGTSTPQARLRLGRIYSWAIKV